VKDGNGDMHANSHNILNMWEKYFSQLLNMHKISDVRQIEIHVAEQLATIAKCIKLQVVIKFRQN
jgi:hypothetical protein